ncbi:hypothetical protein LCGC14_2339140 [marine sediment metagenome]|uniref:Uncharacterized protein n=1 Tax=marine sediment metagenome TaxID=412755 RepID=A0A0F9CCE6_9ZZZZ
MDGKSIPSPGEKEIIRVLSYLVLVIGMGVFAITLSLLYLGRVC